MATADELWAKSRANAELMKALLPDILSSGGRAYPSDISRTSQTEKAPRKLIGTPDPNAAPSVGNDKVDGGNWFEDLINTPIAKGIINVLSTGAYTVGNLLDAPNNRDEEYNRLIAEGKSQIDATNEANAKMFGDMAQAPLKGLSAGIGQNPNDAILPSDAIRHAGDRQNKSGDPATFAADLTSDVLLDPLTYVGFGAAGAAARGAVRGAVKAGVEGRMVAAGSEAIAKAPTRLEGAINGAKEEMAARRSLIEDQNTARQRTRQINRLLKKNPEQPLKAVEEVIPGFNYVPEKLISGEIHKVSVKDVLKMKASEDKLTEFLTNTKKIDQIDKLFDTKNLDVQEGIAKIIRNNTEEPSATRVAEDAAAKPTVDIPEPKTMQEAAFTERAGNDTSLRDFVNDTIKNNDEFSAAANDFVERIQTPVSRMSDKELRELVDFHNFNTENKVQIPKGNVSDAEKIVKPAPNPEVKPVDDYSRFSPSDRFVMLTEHLKGTKPKYTDAKLSEYMKGVPATTKTTTKMDWDAAIAELRAGNPKQLVRRSGDRVGVKRITRGTLANQLEKLKAEGKLTDDMAYKLPDYISNKYPTSSSFIRDIVEEVPAQLPTPEGAAKLGLSAEDFGQASVGGIDSLTKPTGDFRLIFKQMREGLLPEEDVTRFVDGMRAFAEKPDLDVEGAIRVAEDFLKNNRAAVSASQKMLAPTSEGARLITAAKGGTSPAIGVMKLVPDATKYRKPFTPEESAAILKEQADLADANIAKGILPDETARIADEVLKSTVLKQTTPLGPHLTNKKWSTETLDKLTGGAKKEKFWTTHTAIQLYQDTHKLVSAELVKRGIHASKYQAAMDDMSMRVLHKVDVTLKQQGIFPYLTHRMPKNGAAIRLSLYDVLEAMGPNLRKRFLFTNKNSVMSSFMPSQLMDVAEILMRSLTKLGPDGTIDFVKVKPEAIASLRGEYREFAAQNKIIQEIGHSLDANYAKENERIIQMNIESKAKPGTSRRVQQDKLYKAFTEADKDNVLVVQNLADKLLQNTALHGQIMSRKITMISDDVEKQLLEKLENGSVGNLHAKINEIKALHSVVEKDVVEELNKAIGRKKNNIATPREQIHAANAQKIVDEIKDIPKADKANPFPASKLKKKQIRINKLNLEIARKTGNFHVDPDRLARALEGGTDNVMRLVREDHAWDVATRINGFSRMFNRTFGMNKSYALVTSGIHFGAHLESSLHSVLNDFTKKFTGEQIEQAFKKLQGAKGDDLIKVSQAENDPAMLDMARLFSTVFDESTNNFFSRNGVLRDHMNSILDGMPHADKAWRFINDNPEYMAKEWRTWDNIQSPLKFIALMHRAMTKAAEDISMAANYSKHFGMRLEDIPKAERSKWVRIDIENSRNNFAKLIDRELYYPKEIAQELPALGNLITESRIFKNEKFNYWITQVVDPIISALKLTQTTVKPGHHIMSIIGDLIRNGLFAGMGYSTKEYKESWRILRTRRTALKELSELDNFARLKEMSAGASIKADDTLKNNTKFIIGRKPTLISNQSLFTLLETKGVILPPHAGGVAEDLLSVPSERIAVEVDGMGKTARAAAKVAGGFNTGVTKLTNNRFVKINKFSAERDNWMRVSLALHFMRSRSFNTMEEAADYASEMLRKWAPTARDFTAFESKTMRRVMFYYTWQRGILPRILEAAVERPGWVTIPNKAMYDFAANAGIDPASLGDPFPQDIDIPDYYRQNVLGPQWQDDDGNYWGFNPTSPLTDTLNALGAGASVGNMLNPFNSESGEQRVARNLMGMTTPVLRAPIELATGASVSTGAPITDPLQYLSDYIGPVRTASRVTGHTVGPTLPRRTEAKYAEGLGSQEDWYANAAHEGLNYLTGLQFKNYTSDSATKAAQFQQKDKEKTAQREATRRNWWE